MGPEEFKVMYEEAGRQHRYLLNWRQAAVVGFLVVAFSVVSLALKALEAEKPLFAAWILILASPVGPLLLSVDSRIRELYNGCVSVGVALEAETGGPQGVYSKLREIGRGEPNALGKYPPGAHTVVARALYGGYSLVMLLAGIVIGFLA